MLNKIIFISNRYFTALRNINFDNIPLKGHFEFMFKENKPTQLGRWGLLHDERVNSRIDRSNTDNCGPCGSLKLSKEFRSKKIVIYQ